jgi:hypothetical protein
MQNAANASRQSYRIYLYDAHGSIGVARDAEAASDEEASKLALTMLREQSLYVAAEVWQRARQVCRHVA